MHCSPRVDLLQPRSDASLRSQVEARIAGAARAVGVYYRDLATGDS